MDESPAVPHEEIRVVEDFQVEDLLNLIRTNGGNATLAAEEADAVAGLEVAGHRPAGADAPEAVDAGGNDRVVVRLEAERGGGGIVEGRHDRAVGELAGRRVA